MVAVLRLEVADPHPVVPIYGSARVSGFPLPASLAGRVRGPLRSGHRADDQGAFADLALDFSETVLPALLSLLSLGLHVELSCVRPPAV